jgi:hypothetical protein
VPDLDHLIQYRCVRAEHLRTKVKERVFVYRSGWAYCPAGRDADAHQFLPTGGIDRRQLETQQGTRKKV